jgi:hypothetical protein
MLVTLRVPSSGVAVEVLNTWKQEYTLATGVLTLIILEVNKGAFVISITPTISPGPAQLST